MITLGGDAELELVDSLNPFSEGIVFSVRPPKKSWKNISNLSGGEKTLSSLALVRGCGLDYSSAFWAKSFINLVMDKQEHNTCSVYALQAYMYCSYLFCIN